VVIKTSRGVCHLTYSVPAQARFHTRFYKHEADSREKKRPGASADTEAEAWFKKWHLGGIMALPGEMSTLANTGAISSALIILLVATPRTANRDRNVP
jgi:hypothetical protein